MWARWWARLAPIDLLIASGIGAEVVWLACTHLTAMRTPAAALLAALAAVAVFGLLARHRRRP
ncbi:hypothetical protein [Actinomadura fibrosa]|uniref:Uncharacterized protein n=1 Tax=Actinomadura fibrosa TaxID=111802 RepID=A0ABW2XLM0_9ACTN|nr:hypothetical protein [Actinomadura fibrosa]